MTNDPSGARLRVALFGSPSFALPALEALRREHDLRLVVAQPDKPAGRGMRLRQPAAARRARELGVRLAQPRRLKGNDAFLSDLAAERLDVAVTAAYGKILPAALLDIPRHGVLNVHASQLPRYRGAAPIQWALIRGETTTGITIMQTEAGLDTGPIRHQRAVPIGADETAPELFERLAPLGAEVLLEALAMLAAGTLPSTPQREEDATLAPMLRSEDGRVRFDDPAEAVYARFRGVAGWPGSALHWRGARVQVLGMRRGRAALPDAPAAGTVLAVDETGLEVACGAGSVCLTELRSPGKRALPAAAWARGRGVGPGVRLG